MTLTTQLDAILALGEAQARMDRALTRRSRLPIGAEQMTEARWLDPYLWPCRRRGETEPTPEGHDPCIANLPGVEFACCGHGRKPGYIAFADGTVIRGEFEEFRRPRPAGDEL